MNKATASGLSFLGGAVFAVISGVYWLHQQSVEESQEAYQVIFNSPSQTVLTRADMDRCYLVKNGKPYQEPNHGKRISITDIGYSDEQIKECAQLLDQIALKASKEIETSVTATDPLSIRSEMSKTYRTTNRHKQE